MNRKEIGKADDEHHGSIFDVDDVVVADLRHDIAQRLRQDHIEHRLPVIHADGFGSFKLTLVDAHDAAANRFGHISARVHGNDNDADSPDIFEGNTEEVRQAVKDEHGLQDHRCAAEDLHIGANNDPDNLQEHPLDDIFIGPAGNRLQDAAKEAYHAADQR